MTKLTLLRTSALTAVIGTMLAGAGSASAQTATATDSGTVDEIIVTAQKRDENAQNVPIAITALSSDQIKSTGVTGIADLRSAVPALNVTTAVGGFGLPRIRGIGATGQGPGVENPVAIYIDGVYYGTPTGVLQSLADSSQVAVLKGPQGTLFGRNATGGLIQITTRKPSFDWTGKAEMGYGNYKTMTGSAFLSGPISEQVAFSVSGQYENQDKGFGRNLFTGLDVQTHENWAMRAKLLFKASDATSILLSGDFNGNNGTDPAFINFAKNTLGLDVPAQVVAAGGNPQRDILADTDPLLRSRQSGASLTVDQDLGGVSLKSVTAYRKTNLRSLFDPDGTTNKSLVVDFNSFDEQFTQELNLLSEGNGPFKWVVGAFYMRDKAGLNPSRTTGASIAGTVGPAGNIDNVDEVMLDSYSGFAEGTFSLGDATHVTAGVRYTDDKRSYTGATVSFNSTTSTTTSVPLTPGAVSFGKVSWKLSLDHRFSPELMMYASYNRGFRAGSFGPNFVNNALPVLQPELVDAYEVGLKADPFDHRVRINLAGYYNNQSTVQVMQVIAGVQKIYNAQGAKTYGVDGDITVKITDHFSVFGGFSWSHARYKQFTDAVISIPFPVPTTTPAWSTTQYTYIDSATGATVANTVCLGTFVPPTITTQAARDGFYRGRTGGNCLLRGDASGNKVQNSPDITFSLGGNLDIPTQIGKFSLAGNVYYNGGYVGTPDQRVVQPSFTTVAASLTWHNPSGKLYVKVWGRNLTNAFYRSQIGASNSGDNGYSGAPRTYGLAIGADF